MSEQEIIESKVQAIVERVGFKSPIRVFTQEQYQILTDPWGSFSSSDYPIGDVSAVVNKGFILYVPGTLDFLPSLDGVLAHEIGHLTDKELMKNYTLFFYPPLSVVKDAEVRADVFAAQWGYGESLIETLEFLLLKYPQFDGDESNEHLSVVERVKIIKAAMPKAATA